MESELLLDSDDLQAIYFKDYAIIMPTSPQ